MEISKSYSFFSDDYVLLKFSGSDAKAFLQGQLTCDFQEIETGRPSSGVRLDLKGHIVFEFFATFFEGDFLILIDKISHEEFIKELNKFLISEDVTITKERETVSLLLGIEAYKRKNVPFFFFYNLPCALVCNAEELNDYEVLNLEQAKSLAGFFDRSTYINGKTFLNETSHNLFSINYKKGCFYGQEVVAKLEAGRGGPYFPVYIRVAKEISNLELGIDLQGEERKLGKFLGSFTYKNSNYIAATLFRNFRVDGKEIIFRIGNETLSGKVASIPLIDFKSSKDLAKNLFLEAVKLNNQNIPEKAVKILELATLIDPTNEDVVESHGVILEAIGKRDEAIKVFNNLLEMNPLAVMAHTNLSLIYMRDGRIEEAEEQKAQATIKSFQLAGKSSKDKKLVEEQQKKDLLERERKKEMFLKVLELDPADPLALYGLADYHFFKGEFNDSKELLIKVIEADERYSVAYLLLGKAYEKLKMPSYAEEIYNKGIKIAASKGDLMPANEMQNRLTNLP